MLKFSFFHDDHLTKGVIKSHIIFHTSLETFFSSPFVRNSLRMNFI